MKFKVLVGIISAGFIFHNCGNQPAHYIIQGISEIPHPCQQGGQSSLCVGSDGRLYSSWIEYPDDSIARLQYSILLANTWSEPTSIASGSDWFINWADFPAMMVLDDYMAAHWLQYSGSGTYDYDIQVSLSDYRGKWNAPIIPHNDGIAAEHGFLSLLSLPNNRIFLAWLDGRNTKGTTEAELVTTHAHGHGGAMTLRTAQLDKSGRFYEEAELDSRVCDCCQTDAAMTSEGPVVVYRDRTKEEIRDISIVRHVNGKWTAPKLIHPDNWQIGGCPVNGPAICAEGDFVAIAWFTMRGDSGLVKLVFSQDAGATFSNPVIVSNGNPLGRVDIEIIDGTSVLTIWLEEGEEDTAYIMGKVLNPDEEGGEPYILVKSSSHRRSGFPKLAKSKNQIYMSWTDITEGHQYIKTAGIQLIQI